MIVLDPVHRDEMPACRLPRFVGLRFGRHACQRITLLDERCHVAGSHGQRLVGGTDGGFIVARVELRFGQRRLNGRFVRIFCRDLPRLLNHLCRGLLGSHRASNGSERHAGAFGLAQASHRDLPDAQPIGRNPDVLHAAVAVDRHPAPCPALSGRQTPRSRPRAPPLLCSAGSDSRRAACADPSSVNR